MIHLKLKLVYHTSLMITVMYNKAVQLPYSMGVKEQEYMNWMRIEMSIAIPLAKSRLPSFKAMIGNFLLINQLSKL